MSQIILPITGSINAQIINIKYIAISQLKAKHKEINKNISGQIKSKHFNN
nr:MAG TPA: hypothetical protein [Caudoviricetes sp.]